MKQFGLDCRKKVQNQCQQFGFNYKRLRLEEEVYQQEYFNSKYDYTVPNIDDTFIIAQNLEIQRINQSKSNYYRQPKTENMASLKVKRFLQRSSPYRIKKEYYDDRLINFSNNVEEQNYITKDSQLMRQTRKERKENKLQKYVAISKFIKDNKKQSPDSQYTKGNYRHFPKQRFEQPTCINDQEKLRFIKKQLLARAFCYRGYGYAFVVEEIQESGLDILIQKRKYNVLICSVATQVCRRIQQFLIDECKKKIGYITALQLRLLFTMFLNCRSLLHHQQSKVFIDFFKLTYGLQSTTIYESAACKLYQTIKRFLGARLIQSPLPVVQRDENRKKYQLKKRPRKNEQLPSIWNLQLEYELLQYYKTDQHFPNIINFFSQSYPEHARQFNKNDLKSRLVTIFRSTLKRIKNAIKDYGQHLLPILIKLDDRRVKLILHTPEHIQCRRVLSDVYMDNKQLSPQKLAQIINIINRVIQENEIKKEEQGEEVKKKKKFLKKQKRKMDKIKQEQDSIIYYGFDD